MDLKLQGKTALVTGASMGIGRAIAKGLSAEGVKVCITARRRELLDQLRDEIIAARGPEPSVITADIMDEDAPPSLAKAAFDALGKIDILVNSAGGSRPLAIDAPDAQWSESMTLNFTRVRQLTHAILPRMVAERWGRIVNITGKSEPSGMNAAPPAKAAVHLWAKALSREVGKHGITVNCIPPGRIVSELILRNYDEKERDDFAKNQIPLGRFGDPAELAALAVFLASPLACYITGTVIPVDGGLRRYAY
jgi:3-oxoacyl-[acyl-carrier protein] reductase